MRFETGVMHGPFDITPDELPIFLAETEEQILVLDQGLVCLEKEAGDADLLQAIFRAAHTLKGIAGMIGHRRMVALTHALETALDGLRKQTLSVSTPLIDLCLETVDAIRQLRAEVASGETSAVEVEQLRERFAQLLPPAGEGHPEGGAESSGKPGREPPGPGKAILAIQAEISANSMASAARAYQLMLTLRELGELLSMSPSQEQIETAAPVRRLSATLATACTPEQVRRALEMVAEIEGLEVSPSAGPPAPSPESAALSVEKAAEQPLGEYLVEHGLIERQQLEAALELQKSLPGEKPLIGQILVQMDFITQEALDKAVADHISRLRQALQAEQSRSAERAQRALGEKTVRTSVERLDRLMNLVGELITDRNRLFQINNELADRLHADGLSELLAETVLHLGRITDQLQSEVMSIRMLPISSVFNKFPRLVRDLARKAGKEIDLLIQGAETELDRSVIEEVSDPLLHLIRNSVDHGIESPQERAAAGKPPRGKIALNAWHEQGRINLVVADDGRGIDAERVRASAVSKGLLSQAEAAALSTEEAIDLIFLSGLSTAQTISDVSGRGVGMDIVRTNVERLNGAILVETWPGEGTQFQIILPLTLAIVPTLLVRVGGGIFAIPLVAVSEILRIPLASLQSVNGKRVVLLRDHVLPVINLAELFDLRRANGGKARAEHECVVVVHSGKSQLGLAVDGLIGQQEVVVKSLSALVGETPGISSAAILGDGQVALIVDVQGLFKLASLHHHTQQKTAIY